MSDMSRDTFFQDSSGEMWSLRGNSWEKTSSKISANEEAIRRWRRVPVVEPAVRFKVAVVRIFFWIALPLAAWFVILKAYGAF
jgi:hypothetical protein